MKFIVGIDEVGRGALAGPVAVAVVLTTQKLKIRNKKLGKLADSKKLSAKQREKWFGYLKFHPLLKFELARVFPKTIDKINISRAANLAAKRAFERLCAKNRINPERCAVYLDGGLYLGNGKRPDFAKTVVRGDMKIKTVAMASILAKVTRDRIIEKLAKGFPRYGFEINKGYGTSNHIAAIKKNGPSKVHRKSFDPIKSARV